MIRRNSGRKSFVIEGEKRISASIAQSRLSIIGICFVSAYLIMALRLVDLGIVQSGIFAPSSEQPAMQGENIAKIPLRRGDVFDRNGFLIATTIKIPSLFVDPSMVLDAKGLSEKLAVIIPSLDKQKALKTMSAKGRFGWLAHEITPAMQQKILEIGDPSLGFEYHYRRIYPQENLFAHMLGYTDRDGFGLSGIERSFNNVLAKGEDIELSLDLRLQHALRREVQRAVGEFSAKAGAGVVMDARSGEVLAGVSLPDFDLNNAGDAAACEMFNRMTLGVYELGSIFKIFSSAALLEFENPGMDYSFDARKPLKAGWYKIDDYHAQKRILSVPEVFMYSSNIGSALMGKTVGSKALRAFYKDLGLLDAIEFDIGEVGKPIIPDPWREDSTMTVSYGHGISTSPLQMSAAVASIVNGGIIVRPTLLSADARKKQKQKQKQKAAGGKNDIRIVSEKTSKDMRALMRLAVTHGTGGKADVPGMAVGGKTGTAEKIVDGRYVRGKLLSSFIGAFPIDDPKYIVMVMIDEPKGTKQSFGYATAGWVAAPAVSRIVNSMVSILGIPAGQYDPSRDISLQLLPYIKNPKTKKGKRLASSKSN